MFLRLTRPSSRTRLAPALGACALCVTALALTGCGSGATRAAASPAQVVRTTPLESMFSPGPINGDPLPLLRQLQQLGVDRVRVFMWWDHIAPDPDSSTVPQGFDAADPAAYPASNWAHFDTIVRDAKALGLGIDLTLGPPPPRWAEGQGSPDPAKYTWWQPDATEFGQFVHAVATRYSGTYTPAGQATALPRVDFWSIWNEPNLGFQLAPQAIDDSTVEVSPRYYRELVDAAWSAFQDTGHGHDTILIGELGPAGDTTGAGPGNFNSMAPLQFLRGLYCVDSSFHPLQGTAAAELGCPTDATGSAQFAADHPGLFQAPGFAVHPYSQGEPPNVPTPNEPDYAELAAMGNLERTLDTVQGVYGSHRQLPIWSTEFGYQTSPPDTERGVIPATLAPAYLNWAEYLTWLDPRIRSYDQYQLVDSPVGNFATGLELPNGTPQPSFYAYRMPIYLPATTASSSHPLEVWGCVRPARDARTETGKPQRVAIQFQGASGGAWKTVKTVTLTDPYGYFDVYATFPATGHVRLAWSDPHGPEIYSRTVGITVR